MSTRWAALSAAGLSVCLAGAPALAHHSIQATVDTSRTLQSEMVLTKVDWINPHAWFHFTLTRADGTVVKDVPIEWMGINGLRQQGYTSADAFPAAHSYQVTYFPNRDGTPGGNLVAMTDTETGRSYGRGAGGGPPRPPLPPQPPAANGRPPLTNISY
jgi:hypothetical protein